ncbi:MAG: hypothetical protein PHC51_11575 [bacterium]|nr:hypothetical protein [bacterium]
MNNHKTARHHLFASLFIIVSLSLASCGPSITTSLSYPHSQSLRLLVLPVIERPTENATIDHSIIFDHLPDLGDKNMDTPAEYLRNLVLNELSASTDMDLIPSAYIDAELSHHGFADKDGKINLNELYRTPAEVLCNEIFDCDAVLYSELNEWQRNYYALYSNNSVSFSLRIVALATRLSADSNSGEEIVFSTSAHDSSSSGLFKAPTGYVSLALEPIKGVNKEVIENLAEDMVEKALEPLKTGKRSEFLKSPPPAIYAVAHNADGGNINGKLTVLMSATPDMQASFSLGNSVENIPMTEKDSGNYIGFYYPNSNDSFTNADLQVTIIDRWGRKTTSKYNVPLSYP